MFTKAVQAFLVLIVVLVGIFESIAKSLMRTYRPRKGNHHVLYVLEDGCEFFMGPLVSDPSWSLGLNFIGSIDVTCPHGYTYDRDDALRSITALTSEGQGLQKPLTLTAYGARPLMATT